MKIRLLAVLLVALCAASTASALLWIVPSRFAAPSGGGGGGSTLVTAQTLGTSRSNGGGYSTGFGFTVGGSSITVTHLGRYKAAGDSSTHLVAIRNTGNGIEASVTVDMSASPDADGYVYVALASSYTCNASTSYYLASEETTGIDTFYDYDTTITVAGVATGTGGYYYLSGGGAGSGLGGASASYGPVNLKYTP